MTRGRALKVAIVGYGAAGRRMHAPILRRLPDVRVVAVADVDAAARAAAGADLPAATIFASAAELLAGLDCEAVIVASPSGGHAPIAILALESGRHVYVEKPLATHTPDAEAVVRAWRKAGRVGMTGFNYRLHPLYEAARATIAAGGIGEVREVRSVFSLAPCPLPEWRRRRSSGGGVMLDLAPHHIDLWCHLSGMGVRSVSAALESRRSEDDTATLRAELDGGATVRAFFSYAAREEDWMEIVGSTGRIRVDRYRPWMCRPAGAFGGPLRSAVRLARLDLARRGAAGGDVSFARALRAFVAACHGEAEVAVDLDAGLRAARIVDLAAGPGADATGGTA